MPNDEERDFYKSWGEESKVRRENMKKQAERDAKIAETLDYLSKTIKDFKVSSEKTLQNVAKATKLNELGSHVGNVAKESFKEYGNEAIDRGSKAVGDFAGAVLASLGPYGYLAEKTLGFGKSVGGTLNKFLSGSKKSKSESDSEDKSLDAVVQAIRGDSATSALQFTVYNKLNDYLSYKESHDKSYARYLKRQAAKDEEIAENQKKLLEEQRKIEKENKKFRTLQMAKTGLLIAGVTALTGAVVIGGFMLYNAIKNFWGNKGKKIKKTIDDWNSSVLETEGSNAVVNNLVDSRPDDLRQKQANAISAGAKFGVVDAEHPADANGVGHKGTDIRAAAGTPIFSPVKGKVVRFITGWKAKKGGLNYDSATAIYYDESSPKGRKIYGNDDLLLNGNGIWIKNEKGTYGFIHMDSSSPFIRTIGAEVEVGTVLGKVGSTGRSTGAHLHVSYKNLQGNLADAETEGGLGDLTKFMKEKVGAKATPKDKTFSETVKNMTQNVPEFNFANTLINTAEAAARFVQKSKQDNADESSTDDGTVTGQASNISQSSINEILQEPIVETTSNELDNTKLGYLGTLPNITFKGKNSAKLASDSIAYNATPKANSQKSINNQNATNTTVIQTPQTNTQETITLAFGINEPLARLTKGNAEVFV